MFFFMNSYANLNYSENLSFNLFCAAVSASFAQCGSHLVLSLEVGVYSVFLLRLLGPPVQ